MVAAAKAPVGLMMAQMFFVDAASCRLKPLTVGAVMTVSNSGDANCSSKNDSSTDSDALRASLFAAL